MLYGVKKEEEFLQDLKDPLETLIVEIKERSPKMSTLLLFLNRMHERRKYYTVLISSLDVVTL